ncbi:hypothetical protein C8J57DRAFT_1118959 [Mycena rebaudengoi]|nr:hypothetical protein C8J57DRAFT_1118959 [Mycena rebaudengoi]
MASPSSLQALASNTGIEKTARILIQESKSNILDIDAKIAHLNSQIRDLLCLRQLEREKIAMLRVVVAPIRRLPTELLTDIFLLSVKDYVFFGADCRLAVLRLSHVSPYWRQVAHSAPRLWTFRVTLQPKTKPTEDYLSSTKAWMERSSPLPVSVHVATSLPTVDLAGLMDVLLSVVNRWKTLNMASKSLQSFPQLPSDTFSSLEEVYLSGMDADMSGSNMQAFATAPRLRNVTLIPQIGSVPMPWAQLTKLHINDQSPSRCRSILWLCQSIVSARITTCAWGTLPSSPTKHNLPFLTHLITSFATLPDDSSGHVAPLFDSLCLPKLESFQLNMHPDLPWPADSLPQFLQQSPFVQDIQLDADLDAVELAQFLRHAPSVMRLTLSSCSGDTDHFFEVLQHRDSDILPLVPRLDFLDISGDGALEMMETSIRSRWWSDAQLLVLAVSPRVARLGHVNLFFGYSMLGSHLRERLQDCIDEGLRFEHY